MPRIDSANIRALSQQLVADGKLSRDEANSIIDATLKDRILSPTERRELSEVLQSLADKFEPEARTRLSSFLQMSNATLRNASVEAEKDGVIDLADANKLLALADRDGQVSSGEKYSLRAMLVGSKLTAEARTAIEARIGGGVAPAPGGGEAKALGTNPSGQTLHLKDGMFVTEVNAALPSTPQAIGDSLYATASLIAATDPKINVFKTLSAGEKQQVFQNLQKAIAQVPPDVRAPAGYTDEMQPRQQRSSAATVMLELMRSVDGNDAAQRALQSEILKTYSVMAEKETSTLLRDSMIFQLNNNKDRLVTPESRDVSDKLMKLHAPTQPPYEEWFKDGNNTLKVTCHTGGEFFQSEVDTWKREGFKEAGRSPDGGIELERTYEHEGKKTVVRLTMERDVYGTFKRMDDPDTHIVAYSGHANWGRAIPGELRNAPDEAGKKLVLINQCCGRGVINRFHDKYPDSQLITTRNSSYEREDFNTFSKTLKGIAERRSWESISDEIRNDRWGNSRDNYYFPNDAELRARALDKDHDGISDIVDRLVDFNTFKVQEDTTAEFVAKDHGKAPDRIDGTKVHEAAQLMNTTTKFSDFMENHAEGESFIGSGYFKGGANDPMVRITPSVVDGRQTYEVKVNASHAHATSEALKAEAFYTMAHTPPFKLSSDSKLETTLKALILVGHSLDVDGGYRDGEIWSALLKKHGLPQIDLYKVSACVDLNHVYAGSDASIAKLRTDLGAELLAKIEQAVG